MMCSKDQLLTCLKELANRVLVWINCGGRPGIKKTKIKLVKSNRSKAVKQKAKVTRLRTL